MTRAGLPAEALPRRAVIGLLRRSAWRLGPRPRRALLRRAPLRALSARLYGWLGECTVPEPRYGFALRVDMERFEHRSHFRTPHVERDVVEALRAAAPAGAVAVDVGAFCGWYTCLLAAAVGPGGRVVAFEPLPEHADRIERNLALNGFDHASVERVALDAAPGTGRMRDAGAMSSLVRDRVGGGDVAGHGAHDVEVTSIDSWFAGSGLGRLDVVKIDAEGAEPAVVGGMQRVLAEHRPVVVVEVNSESDRAEVARLLAAAGYEITGLRHEHHAAHLLGRPRG